MRDWLNETRIAARSLLRSPGFTMITVATLALGIGSVTAVFTLVDGVLLSPLPFEEPGELISVEHSAAEGSVRRTLQMSSGLYPVYREDVAALEEVGLWQPAAVNLIREGEAPERVPAQLVTPSFFSVLRVDAAIGRTFTETEGDVDGEPVAILSDGLWRTGFAASPDVVGRTVDIDGVSRTVVGVMPPGFGFPDPSTQLWIPFPVDRFQANPLRFDSRGIARLADGGTATAAASEVDQIMERMRMREYFPELAASDALLADFDLRPAFVPLREAVVGDLGPTLWILFGGVGFLLLIACANVANLNLIRSDSRQRERALRLALGSGRAGLVRRTMVEAGIIVGIGGALGVLLAQGAVEAALRMVPTDLPRLAEIGMDPRVLGFAGVLVVAGIALFGLLSALRMNSEHLHSRLREAAVRGGTSSPSRRRMRNGLVVLQMALSLVLLVGSGLMVRSYRALGDVDPGFEPANVLTARFTVPEPEIPAWQETAEFFRELQSRLAAQAGVTAAGFGSSVPLIEGGSISDIQIEDHPRGEGEVPILTNHTFAGAGFTEGLGIELLEGRRVAADVGAEGAREVTVSQAFAERWWPGESPIGRRIRFGFPGDGWYRIVGVLDNARFQGLAEQPVERVYWPMTIGAAESPTVIRSASLVVRTEGDPLGFVPILRRVAGEVNPRIAVAEIGTMEELYRADMARTSFTLALLAIAAAVSLTLGLVGIYGVISYAVSQRTREIGIRIAVGATRGAVKGMVVREGLTLVLVGLALGLAGGVALSGLMASQLYEVSPTDPIAYGVAATALLAVALLATWLPAARAAGVEPTEALRAE